MNKLVLVRVPYLSQYNLLDVREEPVITSLCGFLYLNKIEYIVADFHLDRSMTARKLASLKGDKYIIGVRGTGLHWKYAKLLGDYILSNTSSEVIFYGQTGKISKNNTFSNEERVLIIPHDEEIFSLKTGIGNPYSASFSQGLIHRSYYFDQKFDISSNRVPLFKATIETTRGCHFGCKFCFINHGTNYSGRFLRREPVDVIRDVEYYISKGVNNFWFYDSELIGADIKTYKNLETTFQLLADVNKRHNIEIMIYSRADTMAKFNRYDLLKMAGVSNILMGIESFSKQDNKSMRKSLSKNVSIETIESCVREKIFCHLSFILFNRGSTLDTIKENIDTISDLYRSDDFVYLGQTHYLSYQFESDWKNDESLQKPLSGESRLIGSTSSTLSADNTVVFDSEGTNHTIQCVDQ